MTNLDTAFFGGQNLVPVQPSFTKLVQAGMAGGTATVTFFNYQNIMQQFIKWVNSTPGSLNGLIALRARGFIRPMEITIQYISPHVIAGVKPT